MRILDRIVSFFVKDSFERRRFVTEFNMKASTAFQSMLVDTLLEAMVCEGDPDSSFRHELSAPRIVSGFVVQAKAGAPIPVDDVILIGRIILSDQTLVRKMFVLHWDTLIVQDMRTGKSVRWKIRDFLNFGGLLHSQVNF